MIENSYCSDETAQVVWTCWQCVCVWVTGLGACSADSAQTGCCGCLAQWQRDNKAATQGEGTDRGPRMSRVNCPPKTLPLFFPKILSCFKICCPCTFHVSEKRRWWCLQHCLRCVCVCVCLWCDRMFTYYACVPGRVFLPAFSRLPVFHRL